ncbi:MAG TPA: hypothetical protein VK530_05645 [Candidatus Acidoferrum sp.]|nr:hypothetical protein [Candidatus Acidoferrum sp.]
MESSPENFESLQKLLRLKRYEQPHPRYFNDFSSRVLARIEVGEARAASHWWERFGIDLRPVLTVGAGAVACVSLFFSVAAAPESENPQAMALGISHPPIAAAAGGAASQDNFVQAAGQGMVAANSTNPVFNAAGTMMLDPWRARVMPASYQIR